MIENIYLIFYKILYMSIVATTIGIMVLGITKVFDSKLSAKWKSIMLLIPLLLFIIPINRIQVNTNTEFAVSEVIQKVETTITDLPIKNIQDNSHSEISEDTFVNSNTKDINNKNENRNIKDILYEVIPVIWMVVCILGICMLAIGNIVLMYNVSKLKTNSYERLNSILEICKNKLNIKRKICIKIRNNLQSPCIYGIISPKILIPKELIKENDELLLNIFMHELSHYKRKDMITNFVLLIISTIHWFNPFVYILFKKTRQNIEMATDEMAINKMNKEERKEYGFTLINLLQIYQNQTSASRMLCIADDAKNMEKRIKTIKLSNKNKIFILVFAIILIMCMLIPFTIKANTGSSNLPENNYNSMEEYLSIGKKLYTIIENDVWSGNWTRNTEETKNGQLIINCEILDQYKQNMTETVFNEYIKYFNITKNGNKYSCPTGYAANPRFISDEIEIQNKLDNKVNFNVNAKYKGDNGEIITRVFSFTIVNENDNWIISQYHCPFFETPVNSDDTVNAMNEEKNISKTKDDIDNKYSLESKYIGDWNEEDNEANRIIIKSIKGNMFSFDLSMHRIYEFENLTATMISENTATFNTNDNNDAGDTWKGVYGVLKFEDNQIRLSIKQSDCEYINTGLEFTYNFN